MLAKYSAVLIAAIVCRTRQQEHTTSNANVSRYRSGHRVSGGKLERHFRRKSLFTVYEWRIKFSPFMAGGSCTTHDCENRLLLGGAVAFRDDDSPLVFPAAGVMQVGRPYRFSTIHVLQMANG